MSHLIERSQNPRSFSLLSLLAEVLHSGLCQELIPNCRDSNSGRSLTLICKIVELAASHFSIPAATATANLNSPTLPFPHSPTLSFPQSPTLLLSHSLSHPLTSRFSPHQSEIGTSQFLPQNFRQVLYKCR